MVESVYVYVCVCVFNVPPEHIRARHSLDLFVFRPKVCNWLNVESAVCSLYPLRDPYEVYEFAMWRVEIWGEGGAGVCV